MAISAICALIQACAGSASFRGCHGDDRIFLAGDAAHVVLPNGGFGGNTGVHDAHNLAWKLAYVLKGVAGPGLLATYDAERRPVGEFTVEQSYSRYGLALDGASLIRPDGYIAWRSRDASAISAETLTSVPRTLLDRA